MAKFALLIEVRDYGSGFDALPGIEKPLTAMQRILKQPDVGNFTEVIVLKNPAPLTMQLALETLFKDKVNDPDDLVLLFFSGYCINDHNNKLYLATTSTCKNTKGELVKSTAVSANFILDIMNDSKSKQQLVILNCCFSNAFADVFSAKNYGAVDVKNQLGGEERVVMTSSISTQQFNQQKREISTYISYLVDGIESGAADLDQDNFISVEELHKYISKKVEENAAVIEPEIYGNKKNYKILIAKVPKISDRQEPTPAKLININAAASYIKTPTQTATNFIKTSSQPNLPINLTPNVVDNVLPASRKLPLLIGLCLASVLALTGVVYALRRSQNFKSLTTPETSATNQISNNQSTIKGHLNTIWTLAFNPNGQTLASASGDKTIKIWSLNTKKIILTLQGHLGAIWSIAFSSDGQILASGSSDKTIKIWSLNSGKLLRTFSDPGDTVWSVALSSDGKMLASGIGKNIIKVWNLQTGKLLYTISGHSDKVRSIAFSPDGKLLASGSWDKTVKVWNLQTGKLINTFSGSKSRIISIAISSDGQYLASGGNDQKIYVWNLPNGSLFRTLAGHSDHINSVAISSDGQLIVSASEDHLVKLWNLQTGALLNTFSEHSEDVYSVVISPDAQIIVSGDKEGQIKFWQQ